MTGRRWLTDADDQRARDVAASLLPLADWQLEKLSLLLHPGGHRVNYITGDGDSPLPSAGQPTSSTALADYLAALAAAERAFDHAAVLRTVAVGDVGEREVQRAEQAAPRAPRPPRPHIGPPGPGYGGQLLQTGARSAYMAHQRAPPGRRRRSVPRDRRRRRAYTGRVASRARAASRAQLSARGRRMYGLGITRSWRTANYAYPRGAGPDRGKRPSYPIDPRHVRAALARASQRGTASSRSAIEARLRKRYGSVANALAAARRSSARSTSRSTRGTRRTATARTGRPHRSAARRTTHRTAGHRRTR